MWLIAAVQSTQISCSVRRTLTNFLVSVCGWKGSSIHARDHGKQTIAAARLYQIQGPTERRSQLQVFHHQHGDQRCPELRFQGIGGSTHKRFHTQRLFQSPEKTTRSASALCRSPLRWPLPVPCDWSETPTRDRAAHRKIRSARRRLPGSPAQAYRKRPLHPVVRRAAVELPRFSTTSPVGVFFKRVTK